MQCNTEVAIAFVRLQRNTNCEEFIQLRRNSKLRFVIVIVQLLVPRGWVKVLTKITLDLFWIHEWLQSQKLLFFISTPTSSPNPSHTPFLYLIHFHSQSSHTKHNLANVCSSSAKLKPKPASKRAMCTHFIKCLFAPMRHKKKLFFLFRCVPNSTSSWCCCLYFFRAHMYLRLSRFL